MLTTGLMSEDSSLKVRVPTFHSDTTASMLAFNDNNWQNSQCQTECFLASFPYPRFSLFLLDLPCRAHVAPAFSHRHGIGGHSGGLAEGINLRVFGSLRPVAGKWLHEFGYFGELMRFNSLWVPARPIL